MNVMHQNAFVAESVNPLVALSYQNDVLVKRFSKRNNVPLKKAHHLFEEMKKFLIVCRILGEPCSPSKDIDEMWHHFILHTRDYRDFCMTYLGKFIHHNPTEAPVISSRKSMIDLAEKIFGSIDRKLWPSTEKVACDSFCSSDDYCSGDS